MHLALADKGDQTLARRLGERGDACLCELRHAVGAEAVDEA